MAPKPHEALLYAPGLADLDRQLRELGLGVRTELLSELYAAAPALQQRPRDSLWLEARVLGPAEFGALRTLRALAPQLRLLVLGAPAAGAEAVLRELRALGARTLPWPSRPEELAAATLGERSPESPHAWLAGLADQLANPLAALSGRVQLLQILHTDDAAQRAQLEAAMASVRRLEASIQMLRRIGAPPAPRLHAVDAFAIAARSLLELSPSRVRVDEAGSPAFALTDEELLEECCIALARTLLGLAPEPEPITLRRRGAGLELVLDPPGLPLPVPAERLLAPFALSDAFLDPSLGLEPPLAAVLAAQLGAPLEPLCSEGLLRGFSLQPPAKKRAAKG